MERVSDGFVSSRGLAAVVFVPPLVVLAATACLAVVLERPPGDFVRDPTTTLSASPLTGFVSSLGVLGWWTGAVVAAWTWLSVRSEAPRSRVAAFFLAAATLTAVLALDDLFLMHETLAPERLGVHERVVIGTYAAAAAVFGLRFRELLAGTKCRRNLLLAAVGFLGASLAVDFFSHLWGSEWRVFVEDGLKLVGIFAWTGYLGRSSWLLSGRSLTPPSTASPT